MHLGRMIAMVSAQKMRGCDDFRALVVSPKGKNTEFIGQGYPGSILNSKPRSIFEWESGYVPIKVYVKIERSDW